MRLIVVLNDRETYSEADGCELIRVPEDMSPEVIEEYLKCRKFEGQPIIDTVPSQVFSDICDQLAEANGIIEDFLNAEHVDGAPMHPLVGRAEEYLRKHYEV